MTESRSHPTDPFGPLKLQTAQLILAGFRRDSYAGVFRPVPNRHGGRHVCHLLLDGLGRRLQMKVKGLPSGPESGLVKKPTVALHGLPVLVRPPRAELSPLNCTAGAGQQFTASLDMHVATLRLGVVHYLPAPGASNSWICVLEILRGEGC
jgi:hypothetical protein